jgi:hypothetical protein
MNPRAMPLSPDWKIDWSYFFPLGGDGPLNFSRKFSPHIAKPLTRDINLEPNAGQAGGLMLRDFFRAEPGRIRSTRSCIAHVDPALRSRSRLLSDPVYRREELAGYLATIRQSAHAEATLTDADIETLADDPPLLFFTLFEAMREAGGESLGILGSVIAAEVFREQLTRADAAWISGRDHIAGLSEHLFGDGLPETMPDLLRFLGRTQTACLAAAAPSSRSS